jgi:transcriptional regulator with GAF, ATPase, and Fis domain
VDAGIETNVHDGRVREDLFRRLSVTQTDLPPVRTPAGGSSRAGKLFRPGGLRGARRSTENVIAASAVADLRAAVAGNAIAAHAKAVLTYT